MEDIRAKSREAHKDARAIKRSSVLGHKRVFLNKLEKELEPISIDQVKELANELKKSMKEKAILRKLKHAFAQGDTEKQVFLRCSGALHGLIGLLTGHNADLQLEALSCIINFLTADHKVIKPVVREASPYLILYLNSSTYQVQEMSVWALGNISADCTDCCEVLKVQKFLPALLHLLEATTPDLLHSVLFALRCYMKHCPQDWGEILESLASSLPVFLKSPIAKTVLLEAAHIFFYLSTSSDYDQYLLTSGCIDTAYCQLSNLVAGATKGDDVLFNHEDSQIVMYLVRGLAGAFAGHEIVMHHMCHSAEVLKMLLSSNYLHLHKETLWLLANLAGRSSEEIARCFKEEQLLRAISCKLFSTIEIVEQCLICLNNLMAQEDLNLSTIILACISNDVLVQLLCSSHPVITPLALSFVLLSQKHHQTNPPHLLEKLHFVIQGLSYHPNENIRNLAVIFLQA